MSKHFCYVLYRSSVLLWTYFYSGRPFMHFLQKRYVQKSLPASLFLNPTILLACLSPKLRTVLFFYFLFFCIRGNIFRISTWLYSCRKPMACYLQNTSCFIERRRVQLIFLFSFVGLHLITFRCFLVFCLLSFSL